MSSTFGPKGPPDTLAKVLPFAVRQRQAESVDKTAKVETVQKPEGVETLDPTTPTSGAVFEKAAGQATVLTMPVEGAALSQLVARLQARIDGSPKTGSTSAVQGPTIVQTDEGAVLSGSVQVENRASLHKLDGVVRIGGSLSVEGPVKNADLLALRELKTVEGRLTFEGLSSL